MNQELPAEPRDKGLEDVLREVGLGAGPSGMWEPTGEQAAQEPLRLLVSRKLSLVAVIDYRLVQDQVRRDVHGPDQADFLTGLDQIAREVRFAIQDADTAQVPVLIVAVQGEGEFKELSRGVFGPGGSKGDVVVRVVNVEEPDTLDLDLEVVREEIAPMPGQQWSGAISDFDAVAGKALRDQIDGETEEAWADQVITRVEACFRRPDAERAASDVSEHLRAELAALLDELAPATKEGAQ